MQLALICMASTAAQMASERRRRDAAIFWRETGKDHGAAILAVAMAPCAQQLPSTSTTRMPAN